MTRGSTARSGRRVVAILLVLISLVCIPWAGAASNPRPNIIFILADDLGYGDLGCYGQRMIATPHLDRMAAEGMRCTQCYAGSTVCAPSRCVLMTGLHTGHARIRGNALTPLHDSDPTVAKVLRDAGYGTAIIGKWGLGEPGTTGIPNRQGFDEWFGYLNQHHAHNYFPDYLWHNERRIDMPGNAVIDNVAWTKGTYSHDLFARRSLEWLSEPRDRPFFLYLALTAPHANNEAGRALGDGMETPDYGLYRERPWPAPERGRAAMIQQVDECVGRILARLNELGIGDETIVFFTSDNGPHSEGGSNAEFFDSNGPLRGIKRDLTEGGIRVPMLIRWPGHVPAGVVSDPPWGFWDFLSTAADIAGVKLPGPTDGRSILPTLLGRDQPAPDPFYWEFHEGGFRQAVRFGDWKAIRTGGPGEPVALYNLASDVGETKDLSADHPQEVRQAVERMATMRVDSAEFPIRIGKSRK